MLVLKIIHKTVAVTQKVLKVTLAVLSVGSFVLSLVAKRSHRF